jgi:hypothetical protein
MTRKRKLVDYQGLCERGIKFSRRWLYDLAHRGLFPVPVVMNGRLHWYEDEIDGIIDNLPRAYVLPEVEPVPIAVVEPAPISPVVQLPRRRIRRRNRSASGESSRAEAAWIGTLRFMA